MLVKLYSLPDLWPRQAALARGGVEVRQALPTEKRVIADWVRGHFSESTAGWCEVAIEQRPITCFIAVQKQVPDTPAAASYELPPEILLGVACYDTVAKGMFGPEGVRPDRRGQGIGSALLLACLHAMRAERYAYAIIGWAGAAEFYAQTVGAVPIADSEPGVYKGPLCAAQCGSPITGRAEPGVDP
jgi:GNAT superfamily N-acetyltransferase